MLRVDCRRCAYFLSITEIDREPEWYLKEPWLSMPKEEFERLLEEIIVKEAKGERVLGLCVRRRKPVFYYEGKCRYFKPKHVPRQQTLDKWIPLPRW